MPAKTPRKKLTSRTMAKRAATWALDKQALDVVALDMRRVTDFTEYFVICSGAVDVHVRAISDYIQQKMLEHGFKPLHVEGENNNRWVLLDYVDIIVHIFQPDARGYYALERMWGDAPHLKLPESDR